MPNRTDNQRFEHEEREAALRQYGTEFSQVQAGWFNQLVNGLNRLPRPVMALGTVGLFGFAMVDPEAFSRRMVGLNTVPRELWWLLGAVVSFYFGAREMHYQRRRNRGLFNLGRNRREMARRDTDVPNASDNPAVSDWQQGTQ